MKDSDDITLKVNATYVGDLRDALKDLRHDQRIEARTLIVGSGLTIDEIAIDHETGNVVLYVGLNAESN